jgi:hypothetical protein
VDKTIEKHVTLQGTRPVMFDRYSGSNKLQLERQNKMYLKEDGTIYLPSLNLLSFLSATNTESAPKLFLPSKEYRGVASALASAVAITPDEIPFTRNGKVLKFGEFEELASGELVDKKSGVHMTEYVARVKCGIPHPNKRPVLPLPWTLEFDLFVGAHEELSEQLIEDLFTKGGLFLGIGTFRKVFGKFEFSWK